MLKQMQKFKGTCNMNKIYVTRPLLPNINDYISNVKKIFSSQWLTNMVVQYNELETKLQDALKVPNVSLFNNGTIALLVALKTMDLPYGSEVITTPFSFAATPHCIIWHNCKPVFCDIEPNTMTTVSLYYQLIKELNIEDFPISFNVSKEILNLPVHQDIEFEDIGFITTKMKEIENEFGI